ncbi:MAG TPA: PA2779 family protein [Burkholderiales bacterium]
MDTAWARTLCRLLIALMIWTPYQIATAGIIGTDQVVTSSAQSDRATLLAFMSRGDVQNQLQALGVDPATAQERVAAMSDEEVRSLAGRIGSMPAGGISDAGAILLVLLIAAAVWWFWRR